MLGTISSSFNPQEAPLRVVALWRSITTRITQMQEEHDIFRSKPTVGSVCGGMCRALPFARFN